MLYERTFSNGFELVIQPTHVPVAALQVWVDVGSIDESPQEAGFCHFLEHMLFKGTKKRTTAQIAGSVEGNGGDMNAFTSYEHTVYHITIASQRWELANEILADMVLESAFIPEEFHPEKEVVLEEIKRSDDSPDGQLYRGAYKMMYGNLGYGRPVIGYPSTLKPCSPAALKQFWKRWYSPSLMTLVVCGDVDPALVEAKVKKTWGMKTAKASRPRRRDIGFDQPLRSTKLQAKSQNFAVHDIRWVGNFFACSLKDEILPALDVSAMILGQGESSRLHQKIFKQAQLVTNISAGVWAPASTGLYSFDVEVPLEKGGKFKNLLLNEIHRFCDEGPDKDEMERAKVAVETQRVYTNQSMDGLAHRLGFFKTALGNIRFDLEYIAATRELSAEDVRDAAKAYLHMGALQEYALFPKEYEQTKFWEGATSLSTPTKHKKSVIEKEVLDHEQITLPNGIELILYPRQDIPIVSISACLWGGQRKENRKTAGISQIMAEMWEKGPQGWSSEKFSKFLEKYAAKIDAYSGRNSVNLNATFLTTYLDHIVPVFLETLLNPAMLDEEFKQAQRLALEGIHTLEDDLGRLVSKLFFENLFENHPYAFPNVGYKDSISGLSPLEVTTYFKKIALHKPLIISICGKFNPTQVISMFEKIPSKGGTEIAKPDVISPPRVTASRYVEMKKNREQSHLILGFLGTKVTDKIRYDLKVLLTVLGGQSGRLFREIRDKQGLCYTVAPLCFEGIEPGFVGVYMACDPVKRSQGIDGIRKELDQLVSKPISYDELKRAKEFVLGRHFMEMQLNAAIASTSSLNTLYGLGFDEHLKWRENLKRVTPQTVQRLAEQLFTKTSVTAVVV